MIKEIYLGAGPFHGTEKYFSLVKGIIKTEVGYIDKTEIVHLKFDENKILLSDILDLFYDIINPIEIKEEKYKSIIYYTTDKEVITSSLKQLQEKYKEKITIEVKEFSKFIKASEENQQYITKNPFAYCHIPRDKIRKAKTFQKNKPAFSFLNEYVTKSKGTEPPFINAYWDLYQDGIYVDIETGKALFSSTSKYNSGYGWPSFYSVLNEQEIYIKIDYSYGMMREEVLSTSSNNHLGYRFNNGPIDKGGKRYSINSASIKFIPKEELQTKGYKKYLKLFK